MPNYVAEKADARIENKFSQVVTNCITEIPQDINLELNDGVLTLKAGSKIWYPDGLNEDGNKKYDHITTENDLTVPKLPYDVQGLIFYDMEENRLFPLYVNQCYSGETEPSDLAQLVPVLVYMGAVIPMVRGQPVMATEQGTV